MVNDDDLCIASLKTAANKVLSYSDYDDFLNELTKEIAHHGPRFVSEQIREVLPDFWNWVENMKDSLIATLFPDETYIGDNNLSQIFNSDVFSLGNDNDSILEDILHDLLGFFL